MSHNGPIGWTQAHRNALTVLTSIGLEDDGMGNQSSVTGACLNQATHSSPNLIYRRKADIDYGKPTEDVANATQWMRKSIQTRKENEERKVTCTIPTLARGPNLI